MKRFLYLVAIVVLAGAGFVGHEAWRVFTFQRIAPGMTAAQVQDRLGEPTERHTDGRCLGEQGCEGVGGCWLYRQRLFEHLVVSFDGEGKVTCRETYRPEVRVHG